MKKTNIKTEYQKKKNIFSGIFAFDTKYSSSGFTLIEVMVSVAIFTSIMILAIGALLSSNSEYKRTHEIRSSLDTMSYVIEDMSRNIRLGSSIRCEEGFSYPEGSPYPPSFSAVMSEGDTVMNPDSCDTGDGNWGITIEPLNGDSGTPEDQVSYRFVRIGDEAMIYKTKDGGENYYPLTPENVVIDPYKSSFRIFGTGDDGMQPMVVISISGNVFYKEIVTPFNFQTTVSQRFLDYELPT